MLMEPPPRPSKSYKHESIAIAKLNSYSPGLLDKLLKRTDRKHDKLNSDVIKGRNKDAEEYENELNDFTERYDSWLRLHNLAKRINEGDHNSFVEICNYKFPFNELRNYLHRIEFQTRNSCYIEVLVYIRKDIEIVPEYDKSVLKSGKLSVKKMSKTKFYKIYHDFVWSCTFRIAREVFAILPIDVSIINVFDFSFHFNPIISVIIHEHNLRDVNFDFSYCATDLIEQINYRMKFLKTKGFREVQNFSLSDIVVDRPYGVRP